VPNHPTRDVLIDTDTASDDAVALIMALRSPGVIVRGITVVAGNVAVGQATRNALCVAELCGSDVPVYPGCDRPMLRPAVDANWFHGRDGLGDLGFAPTHRTPDPTHAVDAILDITRRHPGLTLVTLGPLTNVAVAILRDPTLAARVGRCVIMGGNPCCVGNVTPAAEYNVWCDPEAAEVVLRSGMPVELVGWHLCRGDAALNDADIAAVRSIGTPLADFAIDCNRTAAAAYLAQTGETGISLPDPTAMAVALDPAGIVTHATSHPVAVECHSELTRGMTVVDQLNVAPDPRNAATWAAMSRPTRVVWTIDVPSFKRMVLATLA
jgi:purine nucleosidase